jgi:hypothetical protein
MKKIIFVCAFVSMASTTFAAQSVVCSVKSELVNFSNLKVDGVAKVAISNSKSITVMIIDQEVRIELNRPATQDEINSAYRFSGRTITEMPIAYTQVNTNQMATSAVLMAEGIKIECFRKIISK